MGDRRCAVREVRVLIVDDQEPYRRAMAAVVEATDGFLVAGSVTTGEEALVAAAQVAPDLVLMDVNLPGIDGIEATRRIVAAAPDTVVAVLSTYGADDVPSDAADCGAARYVHKEDFGPAVLRDLWADRAG
jgi:DNA-binding NarL/FixJ family response regulator